MKLDKTLPAALRDLNGSEIFTHNHLPIAAAYCRRLGLVDMVNSMVDSQMDLKPGLVVQAMVLDTLSGRTPLYRIKDFLAEQDIKQQSTLDAMGANLFVSRLPATCS